MNYFFSGLRVLNDFRIELTEQLLTTAFDREDGLGKEKEGRGSREGWEGGEDRGRRIRKRRKKKEEEKEKKKEWKRRRRRRRRIRRRR
jgi:hypothetical protein